MTKTDTQQLIQDIIDEWNEIHPTQFIYEDNMTDDSVCAYRDENIEFNLEPIEGGISATFFNLDTNTVDDQFEFTYGGATGMMEWVDEVIYFLMGQFDFRV